MKNKWLYFTGTGFSSLGDGFQTIVMTWQIYKMTENPLAIGGMITVSYLPALFFAPFAGVFVDHRDAKRMAVLVDLVRGGIVAAMVLLIVSDHFSLVVFYLLQFLLALMNTLFKPALQAMVKEAFFEQDLVFVLTKQSSINEVMTVAGTGLSVLLVTMLPTYCFLLFNAASFLLSALCNSSLKRTAKRAPVSKKIEFLADLRSGWQFLVGTQGVLYLLFLSVISSISLQLCASVLAPYVNLYLGGSNSLFALLETMFSLGSALAGLVVARALSRWGQNAAFVSLIGMGVFALLAGWRGAVPFVVASIFGLGFFTMYHLVMTQTLIQVNTPKELIGRVVGLRQIVASLTKILTTLTATGLLNLLDIRYLFWGFAAICACVLLTAAKVKQIPVPEYVRSRSIKI